MRVALGAVLACVGIASAGCFPTCLRHSEVELTFINTTDSLLCYHLYRDNTGCLDEIKPNGQTTWIPGCGYGADDDAFDLNVIITVSSDGHEIYGRRSNCKQWNDAHATFIIKRFSDQFVVTDSLPGAPVSR